MSSLKQADVFMAEVSCSWSQDHLSSGSAEGHRENVSSLKQADVFMAEVSCSWSQDRLSSGSAEGHRENVSSLKQADVFMAEEPRSSLEHFEKCYSEIHKR